MSTSKRIAAAIGFVGAALLVGFLAYCWSADTSPADMVECGPKPKGVDFPRCSSGVWSWLSTQPVDVGDLIF